MKEFICDICTREIVFYEFSVMARDEKHATKLALEHLKKSHNGYDVDIRDITVSS